MKFLPSRDNIDSKSFEEGKKVSGLRRITRFGLDAFLWLIFTGVFYLIYIILYWVFFSSFPLFIVLMASWVVSRMFWMDYFRAFSAFMRRCRAFAHARALSGCRMAYEDLVAWVLK